jgi:hypothetical protein
MINADTMPRFIHIMNTCVSLYLTANTSLLVDIPLLVSHLIVGEIQSHTLKQSVIGGYLERAEDWLARRLPIKQDLQSACTMIGKLHDKAAIQIQRPPTQIQPLAVQIQPRLPAASARKQVEDITADISKLPSPPESFPKSIQETFDVAVTCRDCAIKFSFTVSEQDFYIKTMQEPNFPVRCGPCRHIKKLRNGDPVYQPPLAPPANLAIVDPDVPHDGSWDDANCSNSCFNPHDNRLPAALSFVSDSSRCTHPADRHRLKCV